MIYADPVSQGDFRQGAKVATSYCYAHGLLEDELGYDLLHMSCESGDNQLPRKDGIYTCDVKGYDGGCWAWVWLTMNFTRVCLVVDVADVEGMEFAREHYMNKKSV